MLRACSGHRDGAVAAVGTSTVGTLLSHDPTIRSMLFFPVILLSTWFGGPAYSVSLGSVKRDD